VVIGAGILLGSDISESATRRALDGLIAKGEMAEHDGRYAPVSAGAKVIEGLTEAVAVGRAVPHDHLPQRREIEFL
jgi:hypothetical protein